MESPPSNSTWSEAFILSDDSGLLLTNCSISSGSINNSQSGRHNFPLEDSDCDDKSISQDSLDGMSDIMCSENFNTLKKGGLNWTEFKHSSPIEPPLEFQDNNFIENYSINLAEKVLYQAICDYKTKQIRLINQHRPPPLPPIHYILGKSYWTQEFIPFSPCHHVIGGGGRPNSRSSLGSSRLSSSHNSLSVPTAHRVDDSSFITQAVSHDTLSSNQISDLYNVPFDSDMYAVPIDVVKPTIKPPKRNQLQQHKRKRRNTSSGFRELEVSRQCRFIGSKKSSYSKSERYQWCLQSETKRHSLAGTSAPVEVEPIHMTLQEVRQYLQTLYSSSSDSSDKTDRNYQKSPIIVTNNNKYHPIDSILISNNNNNSKDIMNNSNRTKKNTFLINIKNKKVKDSCDNVSKQINISPTKKSNNNNKHINNNHNNNKAKKSSPAKFLSFKQTLCNMFRFKRFLSPEHSTCDNNSKNNNNNNNNVQSDDKKYCSNRTLNEISSRALPPLPSTKEKSMEEELEEQTLDFATNIQRVKDYGWYWGPLSSEAAEKILSNEPDGSFIVRDSSDDHYIFSLTFKLNNCVRHVRIDHDQGNFSFGSCARFKSQTIVEFIENAVEHSRSGRYLFFLHRRPVIGPVRVQLLHPVSRFKQVQSLQHMCRFVIHKVVRSDLITSLPLPRRMIDYLNTRHYYSEHLIDVEDTNNDEQIPPQNPTTTTTDDNNEENMIQSVTIADVPVNNYVILNNTNNNRQS